jgi:hypothetical protein
MAITLNKVGVEIDGKVYEFYKLSFGFQRKLVEVQSNLNKLTNETAKKYGVDVSEVNDSDKVPEDAKLEIAKAGLELQEALATLFVDPKEAKILDNFDGDSLTQLIEALK